MIFGEEMGNFVRGGGLLSGRLSLIDQVSDGGGGKLLRT